MENLSFFPNKTEKCVTCSDWHIKLLSQGKLFTQTTLISCVFQFQVYLLFYFPYVPKVLYKFKFILVIWATYTFYFPLSIKLLLLQIILLPNKNIHSLLKEKIHWEMGLSKLAISKLWLHVCIHQLYSTNGMYYFLPITYILWYT